MTTAYASYLTPVMLRWDDPPQRFARGGLVKSADAVRRAGRHGDDVLIHVSTDEFDALRHAIGEPTINPKTGLPEYFSLGKIFKSVLQLAPLAIAAFAPELAPALGAGAAGLFGASVSPAVGSVIGSSLMGGALGGLTGGSLKKALLGAGLGGVGAALTPVVGNMFGGDNATIFGQGVGSFGSGAGGALSMSPDGDLLPGKLGTDAGASMVGEEAGAGPALSGAEPVSQASPLADLSAASGDVGALSAAPAESASLLPGMTSDLPSDFTADSASTALRGAKGDGGLLSKYQTPLLLGAGALALSGMGSKTAPPPAGAPLAAASNWNTPVQATPFERQQVTRPRSDYYTYGSDPFAQFEDNALTPPVHAASGGAMGHIVGGAGDGRADTIDAKLSNNEYVMDAETVALLGNGDPQAGAEKLDELRRNLREHKGAALARGKFSPKAKAPEAYLNAGAR